MPKRSSRSRKGWGTPDCVRPRNCDSHAGALLCRNAGCPRIGFHRRTVVNTKFPLSQDVHSPPSRQQSAISMICNLNARASTPPWIGRLRVRSRRRIELATPQTLWNSTTPKTLSSISRMSLRRGPSDGSPARPTDSIRARSAGRGSNGVRRHRRRCRRSAQ